MLFQQTISTQPFTQWLIKDKENKRLFIFSIIVIVASFGWLKFMYPYPNFMPPDSFSYLDAANDNDFINQWPIGYSKFLRLVSVFSRSHLLLVVVQYLLLMASLLYLLFTIRYLLAPGKWLFRGLLAVSIINPLLPHIANFVSSDGLFAALSFVWFTQLLWIIAQPRLRLLLLHAVVLVLAFTVRYSAIWYPFVSIPIILLSSLLAKKEKWLGIGAIAALLLIFIGSSQYEYHKRTGTIQYAAFGGWQLAANGLYAYTHAKLIDPKNVSYKFHDLHAVVNHHMDSLRKLGHVPYQDIGIYYLLRTTSPLLKYEEQLRKIDTVKKTDFVSWAGMATLYGKYGRWLITEHPWLFLKHFAWPNLIRYYKPPANFMDLYNLGNSEVEPIAATWFNWKNNQLPSRRADRNIYIMGFIQTMLAVINPLFLASVLLFVFFSGLKQCSITSKRLVTCMLLVWLCNCVFSVISAPTELRYQIFPVVITLPFCILVMSWIVRSFQPEPGTSLA